MEYRHVACCCEYGIGIHAVESLPAIAFRNRVKRHQNTMLIQIALLAWVSLGESRGALQIIGLSLVTYGALVVQIRRRMQMPPSNVGASGQCDHGTLNF